MGKFSYDDKMRIQTLREQGLGAKAIQSLYPEKNWKLNTVQAVCRRVDQRGSAVERKAGSGRPKSARSNRNIAAVSELICSQEDQPGTSKSTRTIAAEIGVSATSVRRIAKNDLKLSSFKRLPVQVISEDTRQKRLSRSKALLQRLTVPKIKSVFFTDEKIFYIDPPINSQNNRVWSRGKKCDVAQSRLLVQRAKFSARVMVSAGVYLGGRGRLHVVDEKTKINSDYYTGNLLPKLIEDCNANLKRRFIFQQDGAPAHTSGQSQEWIKQNCPDFIEKDQWPPNSPDLNPLDYHVWGAMLEKYQCCSPKPKDRKELVAVLQSIWSALPQENIDKAILQFRQRLSACVKAGGGHFEHFL